MLGSLSRNFAADSWISARASAAPAQVRGPTLNARCSCQPSRVQVDVGRAAVAGRVAIRGGVEHEEAVVLLDLLPAELEVLVRDPPGAVHRREEAEDLLGEPLDSLQPRRLLTSSWSSGERASR